MHLHEYLVHEARRITNRALKDYTDTTAIRSIQPAKRKQFLDMMGLADVVEPARPPVPSTVTGVLNRPGYRIEKLYFESIPHLYITANLYIPEPEGAAAGEKYPAVLCVCGHSLDPKMAYQGIPRRLAQLGFVCLIVDTIERGEARGDHHGCYHHGGFHWYSRGYTPAGVELLNGIRALDLLEQHPAVDVSRGFGLIGDSGGGATTWWLAAADERVTAASPCCGTATLESHLSEKTIDGHCDCMWWVNHYGWDLADVGGLIAPRPLLITSANRDEIFTLSSIRRVHGQLQQVYRAMGAEENLAIVETPGGHGYHPLSRTSAFSWFLQHLQARQIAPDQVGDIDLTQMESLESLSVYGDSPPPDNHIFTIQDDLVPLAAAPEITDAADVPNVRSSVVERLVSTTFHQFPEPEPPLDLTVDFEYDQGDSTGCRFSFLAEEGWRLHGQMVTPKRSPDPSSVLISLWSPGDVRHEAGNFVSPAREWATRVIFQPRGTGDSSYGEELQWHLRRCSAWTGRTLASLRVYDVLRCLKAVRLLPSVGEKPIGIAARGEMAAVALYAALLDGHIDRLILEDPPATQNRSSRPDGRGATIEMLSCLRWTDLPQVAGLLFPCELVVSGGEPQCYAWAESLYARLGASDRFIRTASTAEWQQLQKNKEESYAIDSH